jgi:hypothetical protein
LLPIASLPVRGKHLVEPPFGHRADEIARFGGCREAQVSWHDIEILDVFEDD